jgi:hypothetical protein
MTQARWTGFVIVWLALAVFTVELAVHSRRTAALVEQTPA